MTYAEKLKNPLWQRKRLEVMNRDEFRCCNCYDNTKTLHVHHLDYISGREPWEYDNDYLMTLCHECHQEIAERRPDFEKELISLFRLKVGNTFTMQCILDVFREYKDMEGLFYMLWEMIKRQDEVDEILRTTLFPKELFTDEKISTNGEEIC